MRKEPSQKRSAIMVERILDEATRIMEEDGIAGLTTNRTAAGAGISVGSLYQYFSSKEDIVRALAERYSAEITALYEKLFAEENRSLPIEELVARLLAEGLAITGRRPALKRFLLSADAPHTTRATLEEASAAIRGSIARFIKERTGGRVGEEDADRCFRVTMSLVKALAGALSDAAGKDEEIIAEYRVIIGQYWKRVLGE